MRQLLFNMKQFIFKDFRNFADVILSSAFLAFYELNSPSKAPRQNGNPFKQKPLNNMFSMAKQSASLSPTIQA